MEKCLKIGRILVLLLSSLTFIAFMVYSYWSANLPQNDNIAVLTHLDEFDEILAYSFLTLFILMGAANIALLVSIRAKNKMESHLTTYQFKKE